MLNDFEIVKSERKIPAMEHVEGEIVSSPAGSRVGDVVADNFGQILNIASSIVEIEKKKVQSEAVIEQMAENRKNLLAEAEAYSVKKYADTDSVVRKMQMVRDLMRDFYKYNNNANLSGEDFSRIISSIVSENGKL